jgi:hypothetical protein
MPIRLMLYAVPLVFAATSVAYLIYKVKEIKKTESSGAKPTETFKTVQDYHNVRDSLKFP